MVVLAKEELEQISLPVVHKPLPSPSCIPVIDLSNPDSRSQIVSAARELGFFKVINHGISMELMSALESEAVKFFALPQLEKEIRGLSPFGYGSKRIGSNGDLGWLEYLLLEIASKPKSQSSLFWYETPQTPILSQFLHMHYLGKCFSRKNYFLHIATYQYTFFGIACLSWSSMNISHVK